MSICEIAEAHMAEEMFERDEELAFESFEEVVAFFQTGSPISLSDLTPLKGQKLFKSAS